MATLVTGRIPAVNEGFISFDMRGKMTDQHNIYTLDEQQSVKIYSVKVWDWPLRLFHWLLVATLIFQYVTGEILDDAMQWHFYGGYFALGLILFRLIWGVWGSHYARFSQFIRSPLSVIAYFRNNNLKANQATEYLGHNPAGAYSLIAMLALVLSQAASGLFISDEIFSEGPYYGILGETWQSVADFVHHNGFNAILVIVAIHITAIIYYEVKHKQALTKAMLTGKKQSNQSTETPALSPAAFWFRFAISLFLVSGLMYLIIEVLPPPPADDFYY